MSENSDDIFIGISPEALKKQLEKQFQAPTFLSTGSAVIPYSGILYNVSGSSDDPPQVPGCEDCSWRQLLIKSIPGIESDRCYVENSEAPDDSSHYNPEADYIGGHMTKNEGGHVEIGGVSYLMPLCKWDNSTSRNGVAFQVAGRKILRLEGYMLAEPYVTFAARLPSVRGKDYGLVYLDENNGIWRHKDIDVDEAKNLSSANPENPNQYLLFKKSQNIQDECSLEDVSLL